ncbi:hypothetical protein Hte_001925 [Hypoxylon texense]
MATTNFTFLLASILLTIVRRLFLSPLTRFPGPKLAAVTGLWNANETRLGRASRTHKALHDEFNSDVIRIGPNELSINNVDAIDKLYGAKYLRGTFNQVFNIPGGENVATLRDHRIHSVWRRILAKAFTREEIPHLTERLQTHVDKTVRILHDKAGSSVDCGGLFDPLAFDVISDLAFSHDAGLQDGHGDPTAMGLIHGFLEFTAFVGHLPHLQQILRYLPMPPDGKLFIKLGDKVFDAHQALKAPHKDILSHLQAADRETGVVLSQRDLKQHIQLILTVGAHSVSTTLTCIFAALASRPEIQAGLRKELDAAFEENGVLSSEVVGRLKLLDAVVKEGLRMFPPLQGGTPAIVPKGGVTLATGDFLPEYTHVYVGQRVLGWQERYFPRATEFLPERWMEPDKEKMGNPSIEDRRAWIPFGYGTHACGGRVLALEELKLVVARVVGEFEVRFREDPHRPFNYDHWVDGIKDHFLTVIEEIDLRFVARADR